VIPKGTRGQGFKDSSEKLRNYKDMKDSQGDTGKFKKMLKALITSLEKNT
jgi:hypothetical protein